MRVLTHRHPAQPCPCYRTDNRGQVNGRRMQWDEAAQLGLYKQRLISSPAAGKQGRDKRPALFQRSWTIMAEEDVVDVQEKLADLAGAWLRTAWAPAKQLWSGPRNGATFAACAAVSTELLQAAAGTHAGMLPSARLPAAPWQLQHQHSANPLLLCTVDEGELTLDLGKKKKKKKKEAAAAVSTQQPRKQQPMACVLPPAAQPHQPHRSSSEHASIFF